MKNFIVGLAVVLVMAGCGEGKKADSGKIEKAASRQMKASQPAAEGAASAMISAGVDYLRQGDIRQAIKSFDEAIKENPRDVQGYMILGQTYMHMKEYNRAIDTLTAATQVAPGNGQAHYLLATNFGLAGNYSMARAQAQRSAEIFRRNQDESNFKRSVALLQGLPVVANTVQDAEQK